jgi:hypothetical protein
MPISPDPEQREKQIAALKSGANGLQGRPKGSKNWSTVVKELLQDEELFQKLLDGMSTKPAWLNHTSPKTLMDAITIAQSLKALSGGNGSQASAEWVRKTGFGDKIDITSGGEAIKIEPVVVSQIRPRNIIDAEIVKPQEIDDAPSA